MLLITREQRQKTGDPAFVARVVQYLRMFHLAEMAHLSDEILSNRVEHCIEKARAHGLTYERTLTVFTANMLRLNPEFAQQPVLARILADTSRPEEERVQALVFEASPRDWEEAAKRCDADAYWKNVDAAVMEDD
ncbi:hypothetical protein [Polyangium aurulentum]|uniref:hypothetical protein n=1 Tax=Polyangium aurulentum TaxID=2567896 RepID=UPI0010AED39E|nr:hypothetical protein [Polyangium aurulentum]UQA56817.1 hypothetical protein E8A73_036780 [Polyangium aurulentum]